MSAKAVQQLQGKKCCGLHAGKVAVCGLSAGGSIYMHAEMYLSFVVATSNQGCCFSLSPAESLSVCTKQAVLSGMRRELLTAVPHDPRTLICVLM